MRVSVDQDICMGAEYCLQAAATMFRHNDEGIVELTDGTTGPRAIPEDLRAQVADAVGGCPSGAIQVQDA